MDPSLVGIWGFREERPFEQDIIFTVYPDGRLAQFFRQAASLERVVSSTMHTSPENGQYRVKIAASAQGYLVSLFREGEALVIENKGKRTVCHRLSDEALPPWYAEATARTVWR